MRPRQRPAVHSATFGLQAIPLSPREALVQTKQKWALTLTMALSAVSCGGSTQPGDAYLGFIDATQLDSKFLPGTCGSSKCYQPMTGNANGAAVAFYNLGFLDKSDKSLGKDSTGRPVLA